MKEILAAIDKRIEDAKLGLVAITARVKRARELLLTEQWAEREVRSFLAKLEHDLYVHNAMEELDVDVIHP